MPGVAKLRLGTRGSRLARWQADTVAGWLRARGEEVELVIITTSGDRSTSPRLADEGGKGLFTKELEEAMLDGRIDFAVHSLKDVPAELPPQMVLAAVPVREDVRDALVAAPGTTLENLAAGARVGTGSLRRQAQLLALRPDLEVLPLRGNVDTRVGKWRAGEFAAVMLAAAGLIRMNLSDCIAEWISPHQICPAGGQGALGLECLAADAATRARLAPLHDARCGEAVAAERALLRRLECGCQTPVAAWCSYEGSGPLYLSALVASPDGSHIVRAGLGQFSDESPARFGQRVAEALLELGAGPLVEPFRARSRPS